MKALDTKSMIAGSMIGGAIGDALGAPIEFNSISAIRARFGRKGLTDYSEFTDGHGSYTDDTQMALFTAEGALRAYHAAVLNGAAQDKAAADKTAPDDALAAVLPASIRRSYLRWLRTQGAGPDFSCPGIDNGRLVGEPILNVRRAPGSTCLSALKSGAMGTPEDPLNGSKGCGGIMRVAPIPLLFRDLDAEFVYDQACRAAAITHGHPSGYISAGCLALILHFILHDLSLPEAVSESLSFIRRTPGHEETAEAVERGMRAAAGSSGTAVTPESLEEIGGGWTGEEALGISVACALVWPDDFRAGVLAAVNHSGDSDSTGSITGNILGLLLGREAIPAEWIENLEGAALVEEISDDLFLKVKGVPGMTDPEWSERYPPD